MYKKVIRLLLLFPNIPLFLLCSDFDQYTSAGSGVVEEFSPGLTDFDRNFFSFLLDSSITRESGSLPDGQSLKFGNQPGILAAGRHKGIVVYGYTRFTLTPEFTLGFNSDDILDSIVIVYDTIVDTTHPHGIREDSEFRIFYVSEKNLFDLPESTVEDSPAGVFKQPEGESFAAKITDNGFTESVFDFIRAYVSCIDGASGNTGNTSERQKICDSISEKDMYLAIFSTGDTLTWFKSNPAMVIYSHRQNDDSVISRRDDTLLGYSHIKATESDSLIDSLKSTPVSSWLAGRTAVFKLDFQQLWDTVEASGFSRILSADVIIRGSVASTGHDDTLHQIRYLLSEKFIRDGLELDSSFSRFVSTYAAIDTLEKSTQRFSLPVEFVLQRFDGDRSRYLYLYLRSLGLATFWEQEMLWSRPEVEIVLTTTK